MSQDQDKFQHYNPKAGYLATVLRCGASIVPSVISRAEFWGFMGLHFMVYGLYRAGYLEGAHSAYSFLHVDKHDVKIISAITTFFEVFYTNACYKRYLFLYTNTRRMMTAAYDVCFVMRLYIRHSSSDVTAMYDRIGARWVTLTLMLFLYELKNMDDTKQNSAAASDKEWAKIQKMNLVRPEEVEFLRSLSPEQRLLVMLHACGDLGKQGTKAVGAPTNYLKDIIAKLLTYRAAQQDVIDTLNLPIPFEYFHLLNMMVVMNCTVWAYFMGSTESYFAPVCYFFATLIFMGMMDLASQLSNPFGSDQVDFPVTEWMDEYLRNMRALLIYEQEGTGDDLVRELKGELNQERKWSLQVERWEINEFLDEESRISSEPIKSRVRSRNVGAGTSREGTLSSNLREGTCQSSGDAFPNRESSSGSYGAFREGSGGYETLPQSP
jgi:predicted membrane chloride channel (bestrophin family)